MNSIEPVEVSVLNQSTSALFQLFENHELDQHSVPLNSNTLDFEDPNLNQAYLNSLYQHPGLPRHVSSQLRVACCFLGVTVLLNIIFSVLAYNAGLASLIPAIYHSIFGGIVLCLLLVMYAHMSRASPKRRIILLYYGFAGIYVVCANFLVFASSMEASTVVTPLTVCILTLLFRGISFDGFFCTAMFTLTFTGFHIFAVIFWRVSPSLTKIAQFIPLIVFALMILGDCYTADIRKRAIYLKCCRGEVQPENASNPSHFSQTISPISTNIEAAFALCNRMKTKIKAAYKLVFYQDIKHLLKAVLDEISLMTKQMGQDIHKASVSKASDSGFDAEDLIFLSEYCNVSSNCERSEVMLSTSNIEQKSPIPKKAMYSSTELEGVMSSFGKKWTFDVWFVQELSNKCILPVAQHLFKYYPFKADLHVKRKPFLKFFEKIEGEYKSNPYHNACHAADVCHSLFFYFEKSRIIDQIELSDLLVSLVAALTHDVGHPGLTNRYLINSQHELAIKYNDQSILEHMHASLTAKLINKEEFNFLEAFSPANYTRFRKTLIEMILETDMFRHFELVSRFKTRANALNNLNLEVEEDKIIVMAMGLKVADVSHTAKYQSLHLRWTDCICEEFFLQGDLEKQHGLPVSMYCDRSSTIVSKCQMGFIRNLCVPLFEGWCAYLNSKEVNRSCLDQLHKNLTYWERSDRIRNNTSGGELKRKTGEVWKTSTFMLN